MAVTGTTRLLTPEEIAVKAGEQVPFLRLPERATVFAERAVRLRQLAAGHPMRDYLLFAAQLSEAQHAELQTAPVLALPDAAALADAARAGRAPLPADTPLDPAWRGVLHGLLARLQPVLAGTPPARVVQAVLNAGDEQLDRQAERLLGGVMLGLDIGSAPLIAAALQVCWTQRVLAVQRLHGGGDGAGQLQDAPSGQHKEASSGQHSEAPSGQHKEAPFGQHLEAPFGRVDDPTRCPCCASRPTASITRIGAEASGYRYLHCSLCAAQWHLVRIKCSHCQSTKGIGYQQLEPVAGQARSANGANDGAVQVETCSECGHYLKIVHMARDHQVDPAADDLATVTLDLLVSEAGLQRHGVNLLLLFGDPEPAAAGDADDDDGGGG